MSFVAHIRDPSNFVEHRSSSPFIGSQLSHVHGFLLHENEQTQFSLHLSEDSTNQKRVTFSNSIQNLILIKRLFIVLTSNIYAVEGPNHILHKCVFRSRYLSIFKAFTALFTSITVIG